MKKKTGYVIAYVLTFFILVGCIYLFAYNWNNNKDFFKMSLSTLMTIVTAIIISFYLVQKKKDERRKIDNIDKILTKVQLFINDTKLIDASTQSALNNALLMQKSLANKLEYIKKNCPKEIEFDLLYICNEFQHLRELYGGHFKDEEYIKKSADDFKKFIINIDDKCDAIHMNLYD